MNNKQFFNNLSATYADVRKLDVKKINLKGKNILEYIKESVPVIKHSQDTRETITENDLWGQWVETKSDGTIIIHDDWVTNPNASNWDGWNTSITKIEDNKAYVGESGDTFFANIQTEKIKDGSWMFDSCSNLTSFSSDLSNLTYGHGMFEECYNLTSFTSDLPSLTNGYGMFNCCSNLKSFSSDLSNLTYGDSMFYECTNLKSFSSDLSNLTDGSIMFNGCSNLKSFSSDLPSLTNGYCMFEYCSNLTSFTSDLSSLTDGYGMFGNCKLDAESVMYIADTINDISDSNTGQLTLGINVKNNSSTIQQQLEDFAKEATFETWADLKKHFTDKGWTVTFQYGKTDTSITYDLRNGEQIIPCQIFAKLVQAEDNDSAKYCTEDASTFYNIEWGHDVTDTSSYTQFDSLEDAMTHWNVFPKENIISIEEEA